MVGLVQFPPLEYLDPPEDGDDLHANQSLGGTGDGPEDGEHSCELYRMFSVSHSLVTLPLTEYSAAAAPTVLDSASPMANRPTHGIDRKIPGRHTPGTCSGGSGCAATSTV